ncbi:molybdenum cofactor biosynthesis protein MoaE [Methylopila turkensis]|uniref:Molybdopterin synthase catalytic subunit n=1 Tax=Methylopila turkensis TaxID=1437816 RepID=A0A9W6JJB0_9HYPH|nr:molybdenum cofactor biosynthesis protein MoaE [Methylopila turkensis]GLK78721.1 molybdenum cofactor biosynthesis protein MoaE [Methylopila turkensis]
MAVRVQTELFDAGRETADLGAGHVDAGAVVTFTGLCRPNADSGAPLEALTLECYPEMAKEELSRIEAEARARWPLLDALIVHRHGRIRPGEPIVLVATLSPHRAAAFAAAEFVMDYLKTSAPFWKREETADGGAWVAAKAADDDALERWSRR